MPIVTPVLEKLFRAMHDRNASDIFITAGAPIHIKINGVVAPINQQVMKPEQVRRILEEAIASEALWQRYVERKELNFSLGLSDVGNFRINAFWQRNSPAAVIRYVSRDIPSFEALGLPPVLGEMALGKRGLILVVGPTGSGKSTTLAAMLDYLNSNKYHHILTIEDPIEFVHESKKCLVNQREVHRDTHGFSEALRSALREDPDIILVGEMRDLETIRLALTAAETGHLVFGTLHTTSAAKTIDRVVDVFPAEEKSMVRSMLSESLQAVISQTLLKKIGGGRVAAHEIMIGTPAIRNLIREDKVAQMYSAIQTGGALGMQTLDACLKTLVSKGLVSRDSAREKAKSPENF